MIDIDFNNPVDRVRAVIGDPNTEFVTDSTIISALAKYNSDIDKASLAVMEVMLKAFATLADREREGQLEVYYTKLYERYKDSYDDLKRTVGQKKAIPIIIGGTSLSAKNEIFTNPDLFTGYLMQDWNDIMLSENRLYEEVIEKSIHLQD